MNKLFTTFAAFVAALLLSATTGWGQVSTNYSAGTHTFTVPVGVTEVTLEAWGAGGAGGGISGGSGAAARGGGGGGAYARSESIVVAPGDELTVVVAGTTAGGSGATGSAGSPSFVEDESFTVLVRGAGGSGGGATTGGLGGTVAGSIGADATDAGGDGGNAVGSDSGGGGGGAGTGGAGGNASGTTAGSGTSVGGGNGGTGLTNGSGSNAGATFGGGGSGARRNNGSATVNGGNGAAGRVTITYMPPDLSGFDVVLAVAGNKNAGESFDLAISNATDFGGADLSGSINVTVTSNTADDEVHNASVLFTAGSATVPVTLTVLGAHTLTVEVVGVTDSEDVGVTVDPGAFSASDSTLDVDFTSRVAGEFVEVTVTPMDAFGNLLGDGLDVMIFLDGLDEDFNGPILVTDEANGTYTASVKVTSVTAANVISATVEGDDVDETETITVTAAGAAKLAFTEQPSNTALGDVIAPAVRVQVQDEFDNDVGEAGVEIEISKLSGPGDLTGNTIETTGVEGWVEFDDLELDDEGTYVLRAEDTAAMPLTFVDSDPFDVIAATATQTQVLSGPTVVYGHGAVDLTALVTAADDEEEFPDGGTVEFRVGGTLVGTAAVNPLTGEATFNYVLPSDRNAGAHQLRAKFLGTGTYVGSDSHPGNNNVLTVNQRQLELTAQPDTKVYDGTTDSAVAPILTSGTIAFGQTHTFAQVFDTRNVGTGKEIIATGVVLDGNAGNNYQVLVHHDFTGVINAKALTLTGLIADDKTYDGTTDATIDDFGTLTGVEAIDDGDVELDATSASASFDSAGAGVGKTVTVTGLALTGAEASNYSIADQTTTADIDKKDLTITANDDEKEYDQVAYSGGNDVAYDGFVSGEDETDLGGTLAFGGDSQGAVNVGTYAIVPSGLTSDNYEIDFVNGELEITPRPLTLSAFTADNRVYDGTSDATGTGFADDRLAGDDIDFSFDTQFDNKHVGTDKVVAYRNVVISGGDQGGNYELIGWVSGFTGAFDASEWIADEPGLSDVDMSSNELVLTGPDDGSDTEQEASVSITVPFDGTITFNFTATTEDDNWSYDGVGYTLNGDTFWLSPDPNSEEAEESVDDRSGFVIVSVEAGDEFSFFAWSEDSLFGPAILVTDFAVSQGSALADITPLEITVTAVTDTKVYDGTTASDEAPSIDPALAVGDTTGFFQTFDTKHVGTEKTLTPDGTVLDGNGGNNYDITFVTVDLGEITQAPLMVTAVTDAKTYDGTVSSSGEPEFDGLASGDTGTATQRFDSKMAGPRTLLVNSESIVVLDGDEQDVTHNYEIDTDTASGEIEQQALTITAVTDTRVYDGTTDSAGLPVFVGLVSGDVGSAVQVFDDKHAGSKTLSVASYTIVDPGEADMSSNYDVDDSGTASGTITPAPLTLSAVSDEKVYDSTDSSDETPTVDGLQTGDSVTGLVQSFDNRHVGTGKTLSVTDFTINDGNSGDNYEVTLETDVTGIITVATVTPQITAADKVYDSTTDATILTRTLDGVIGLDDVELVGGTAEFDTASIGTGKTVTATGLSLDGDDATNYVLSSTSATTTADITSAELTIAGVIAEDREYDGTTHVTITGDPLILVGLASGDVQGEDVTLHDEGAGGTFADKNAGVDKSVAVTGFIISGPSASNYTLIQPEGLSATVFPKAIDALDLFANDKTYDTTAEAELVLDSAHVDDEMLITGDDLDVDFGDLSAAPVWVQDDQQTSIGNSGSSVVGRPTNLQVGDLIVVVLSDRDSPTITAPAGFTEIRTESGGVDQAQVAVYARIADGTETSTFTFTKTGTARHWRAVAGRVTGADTSSIGNAIGNHEGDNLGSDEDLSLTIPGITTSVDNALIVAAWATHDDTILGLSGAAGMNQRWTDNDPRPGYFGATQPIPTAGPTGNRTVSWGTSPFFSDRHAAGVLFEIRPVPTTPTIGTFVADDDGDWVPDPTAGDDKPVLVTGVTLQGADAGNYVLNEIVISASIFQAPLTVSGAVAQDKVYDGNTDADITGASLVGVLGVDDVTLADHTSGTFAQATIGTGITVTSAMTLDGADAGNYSLSQPSLSADITAKNLTVAGAMAENKIYDRTTAAAVTGATLVGVVEPDDVSLANHTSGTFAQFTVGTGIGVSTSMTLSGADSGNYTVSQPGGLNADITQKVLTVNGMTAQNKVYDGSTSASLLGSPSLSGVISPDSVGINAGSVSAAFVTPGVGTGKNVNVTGLVLTGADNGNYTFVSPVVRMANITQRPLTVSGITGGTRVYDGTTSAPINVGSAALINAVVGDDVALNTGGAIGTFTGGKNVGTGKPIQVSGLTLTGTTAPNYSLTQPATTGTVTQRALEISASAENKVYDGDADATVVLSHGNQVTGDVVNSSFTSATFDNKNVGTGKEVTVSGITTSGTDAGNYSFSSSVTTTADITVRTLNVTATAEDRTYDGTTDATVTLDDDRVDGDLVELAFEASFDTKHVGEDKVVSVTEIEIDGGVDAGNYTLANTTATANADITQREITVTATEDTKVYDGTADSAEEPEITEGDLAAGDHAHMTQSFDSAAAGTGKVLTPVVAIHDGEDEETAEDVTHNYDITIETAEGEIELRAITVTAVTDTKPYDGTTDSEEAPTITAGDLADGQHAHLTQAFDAPTAGARTLIPLAVIHDSEDEEAEDVTANYDITYVNALGTINAMQLTLTGIIAEDKVYNGSIQATLVQTGPLVLHGVAEGDDVTANAQDAVGTFNNRHVGVGKTVNVIGIVLEGDDADNYSLAPLSLTATITPRTMLVSGITANNKVWNGTTAATLNVGGAALVDPVVGDSVSLSTGAAVGTFSDANVGNGKTVAVSGLALTGAQAGNYSLVQPTTMANITNTAPVAGGPYSLQRNATTQSAKVHVSDLLALASDVDGHTLTITAAGPGTTSGVATVSLVGSWVTYNANGHGTNDSFSYTVTDAAGGTATGTVNVTIRPDSVPGHNIVSVEPQENGSVKITFAGLPFSTYQVQRTTNLTPIFGPVIWTTLGTANTAGSGTGIFFDMTPPVGSAFYRTVLVE